MSEWRSIDSAPRTGEWIVLGYFCPRYEKELNDEAHAIVARWYRERWACEEDRSLNVESFPPTHWSPLPSNPTLNELQSCPFCGGQAQYAVDTRYSLSHFVRCKSCRARGPSVYCSGQDDPNWKAKLKERAIIKWNERR